MGFNSDNPPLHSVRRPWFWLLVVTLVCGLGFLLSSFVRGRFVYGGQTVAQWFADPALDQLGLGEGQPLGPGRPSESAVAFLELRGRAVPYLCAAACSGPTLLIRQYLKFVNLLPPNVRSWLPAAHDDGYYLRRQRRALCLLGLLAHWEKQPGPWGRSGEPVPVETVVATIRACLDAAQPEVRGLAAQVAACLRKHSDALLPDLISRLGSRTAPEHLAMIEAVGVFGPAASNAVTQLAGMVQHPDDPESLTVACALGRIGKPAQPVAETIVRMLEATNLWNRQAAALALYQIGHTPATAAPALGELVAQTNLVPARQAAALALWNLDRHDANRLATLAEMLRVQPPTGCYYLLQATPDAAWTNLIPVLSSLTNSEEQLTRLVASNALYRIRTSLP